MHVHDAAFEQLYTEYVHRLIRYARAQGQSGDVAEELVQDTFHEAYAQLAHLTEHENPGGWLMQTLKNKIRNYDRARQRERRLMAGWTEEMYAVAALGDPSEQWLARQQLSDVAVPVHLPRRHDPTSVAIRLRESEDASALPDSPLKQERLVKH